MQYVVIYLKVNEDREEGLVFNGPFYGPITHAETDANKAAKDLANQTRSGAVVSKIFSIPDQASFCDAMVQAKPIFDRIVLDMKEAKEIVDRPTRKRRK